MRAGCQLGGGAGGQRSGPCHHQGARATTRRHAVVAGLSSGARDHHGALSDDEWRFERARLTGLHGSLCAADLTASAQVSIWSIIALAVGVRSRLCGSFRSRATARDLCTGSVFDDSCGRVDGDHHRRVNPHDTDGRLDAPIQRHRTAKRGRTPDDRRATSPRQRVKGRREVTTPPKRSGRLRHPTALAEVDRGFADALKIRPDLRIGVQISLYLSADLILGLALKTREEVVHGGVGGR